MQAKDSVTVEPAQPAMEIADRCAVKDPPQSGQHRVAKIAVQGRHGLGRDPAAKTVAHHQIGPAAQLRDERIKIGKIIAVVAVAHDHEPALGVRNARDQRRTIPFDRHSDDARAKAAGDVLTAII